MLVAVTDFDESVSVAERTISYGDVGVDVNNSSPSINPNQESIPFHRCMHSIVSIILILVVTLCGVLSVIKAYQASDMNNEDRENDGKVARFANGFAVGLAIFATPAEYFAAQRIRRARNSDGNQLLVVSSWVIYIIVIVMFMSILAVDLGVEHSKIPTELITGEISVIVSGWMLMFLYKEAARAKQ